MRVHHLSCGTLCPFSRRLINGDGGHFERGYLPCHVLLLETDAGLVLVDTGFGSADLATPSRLPASFRLQGGFVARPEDGAAAQIRALGFDPRDVRHILLTHLDLDHAGGLMDFPQATVHLHLHEHEAAQARRRWIERQRYLPSQWAHGVQWQTHTPDGENWHGFERARAIEALGDDVLLIPLHGHTRGHSGIAVNTDDGWLLHCGDAYFHRNELTDPTSAPRGLMLYERIIAMDNATRLANQARLHALEATEVRTICSHDPQELTSCQHAHP